MSHHRDNTPSCQQIIDSFADPYLLVGTDYRIVAANRAFVETYDTQAQGVVGRDCRAVSCRLETSSDGDAGPYIVEHVLRSGERMRAIEQHQPGDGEVLRVQVTTSPIFDDDGELQYVAQMFTALGEANDTELLVGKSRAIAELRAQLERVAATPTTVLLLGESGSGKDCTAQYLHQASNRCCGPFLTVDCATLSPEKTEAELFGNQHDGSLGFFGQADGGTLFIDEIGELPITLQNRLLGVLERGEIKPVGSDSYRSVDVRVVVASNRDPGDLVGEGKLRKDLYYRLTAFPVRIPALRHHIEDVPLLAEFFLRQLDSGVQQLPLSAEVVAHLMGYDYPGNVRELRNVIERAIIYAAGEPLGTQHLVFDRDLFGTSDVEPPQETTPSDDRLLMRRGYRPGKAEMVAVLRECRGHRAKAAQRLGMSERTLYRYLKTLRED